jgi:hypothetical protein
MPRGHIGSTRLMWLRSAGELYRVSDGQVFSRCPATALTGFFSIANSAPLPIIARCDKYLLNNEIINPAISHSSRDLLFCALQLL